MLLEWLSEAEQSLRFRGVLPEEAETLQGLLHTHRDFMGTVEEKRTDVNKAAGMGEGILTVCHPDSITTIKHWITIIRARFEEVRRSDAFLRHSFTRALFNFLFPSTGADVGQTARAAAGDGPDGGAQQRQPAGGAVVMVTVGGDHLGPERHGAAASGHPAAEDPHHGAPGGLSTGDSQTGVVHV